MKLTARLKTYLSRTLPSMEGWCTPVKASALMESVLDNQPMIAVEVGVFAGRSLCAIALAMDEAGSGHVWGIDPWSSVASAAGFSDENRDWWARLDHSEIEAKARAGVARLNLEHRVTLIKSTSANALAGFNSLHQSANVQRRPYIDLLHIDGNHSVESALADVNGWLPLVVPGGEIWFDDTDWETTRPAQDRLKELASLDRQYAACAVYRRNQPQRRARSTKPAVINLPLTTHPTRQ